uniref:Uncharacterized protein n=1 Tax=Oryzias latipes TaxID=8090 RepID=A0A3P9K044_ORYLA
LPQAPLSPSLSSRRFTKNLLKPGSAAEIRQTACSAVRQSAVTVSGPAWTVKKSIKKMGGKRITHLSDQVPAHASSQKTRSLCFVQIRLG